MKFSISKELFLLENRLSVGFFRNAGDTHRNQLKKIKQSKKMSGILKITKYRKRKSSFRGYFKILA